MTSSSGFDAAERQKMQQDRSALQAAQRKDRDYGRMEAAQRAQQRALDAEIRSWENYKKEVERDAQRRQQRLERIRRADDRFHDRLERQQRAYEVSDALAMDRQRTQRQRQQRAYEVSDAMAIDRTRTRRMREEQRLRDRYDILQTKSRDVLTPANFRTMTRQTGILERDVNRYAARYGGAPGWAGGIGGMRTGFGSEIGAFGVQNAVRLGVAGQRAAENKDWVELARINQELKRIENINAAQLNSQRAMSQEQKANAQRMLGAVAQARSRIGAGRSGHSAVTNAMGSISGMLGIADEFPVVAGVMGAAKLGYQAFMLPATISSYAHGLAGLAKPWDQFVMDTSRVGRGGNFNSRALRAQLYGGYNGGLAGQVPDWVKTLGVTSDNANSILGAYGRSFGDAQSAAQFVGTVRHWNFSPYMDMGDQRLAQSAGLATQLGLRLGTVRQGDMYGTDVNGAASKGWFATLQKVMAAATAQGLDHSIAINNVEGLLRQGAGAGATSLSGGGMASFWNRMVSSGLPGMRSGEGVMAAAGGMNAAMSKIGVNGAPAQMFMMQSYFQKNGGMPKTASALQKFLGVSGDQWESMNSTPAKRAMVQQYLSAAQAGQFPLAMSYLQPLMAGNYDLWNKIFQGSAYGGVNPLIKPLVGSQVMGTSLGGYNAMTYGDKSLPNGPGQVPIVAPNIRSALRTAAGATGLPYAVVAGLAQTESSMNPNQTTPGSSAAGLMGIIKGTRDQMGLADADKFDPGLNALKGSQYFAKIYASLDDIQNPQERLRMAYELYNWGPGGDHATAVKRGMEPNDIRANGARFMRNVTAFANMPGQQNETAAQLNQLDLNIGRQIRQNVINPANNMGVTDAAVSFSTAIVNGTSAVEQFTQALIQGAAAIGHRPAVRGSMSLPYPAPMQP
jgi:hypothetical protein